MEFKAWHTQCSFGASGNERLPDSQVITGMNESESLDLVDLPDSPIEPSCMGGGHDLYEEGGYGEMRIASSQPQQNRTCLDVLHPLHSAEYTSAQSLLDAYSRTPPPESPVPAYTAHKYTAHNRGHGQVLTFASDFDQTGALAYPETYHNNKLEEHGYQWPAADRVEEVSPVPFREFEPLPPFTCCAVYDARASVRRSVTDVVSSKLAQDLAYKLEQRRAWEREDSASPGENKRKKLEKSHVTVNSPLQSMASADDAPGVLRRIEASEDMRLEPGIAVLSSIPVTGRELDGKVSDDLALDHPNARRRGDDAAVRRVCSNNRTVEPARTNSACDASAGKMPPHGCNASDMIIINLVEAKMLSSRKAGGLPDPCAWISLHHRGKVMRRDDVASGIMNMKAHHSMLPHFKSATVPSSQDPAWNSIVSLTMAYKSTTVIVDGIQHDSATLEPVAGQSVNIFITVHDAGMKKCDFLGQAAILDILPGTMVDRWVTLQRRDGQPQMESVGGRVSSVRMKIEYISASAKGLSQPTHFSNVTGQGNTSKSPHRKQKGLRRTGASTEHLAYAAKLQAAIRRVFANRVFRLTLLQARLIAIDYLPSSRSFDCPLGKATSQYRKPFSPVNIDAEIIASSSDYCEDTAMTHADTKGRPNQDPPVTKGGRFDLMDYALRDRSILGQAEALANLGLGLFHDREEFREQSLQYLHESWDLLKTLKPTQLQADRVQSIIDRISKSGAFSTSHDLSLRLAGL